MITSPIVAFNIRFLDDMTEVTRTEFVIDPDPMMFLEVENGSLRTYPGDQGIIWEFFKEFEVRVTENKTRRLRFPVLIIDSEHSDEILTDRFTWGARARNTCLIANITLKKLLETGLKGKFLSDLRRIFGNIPGIREHQILRAGKCMTMAGLFFGLLTFGNEVKRHSVDDERNYVAIIKQPIVWGEEYCNLIQEICVASGGTGETLTLDYVKNKNNLASRLFLFNALGVATKGIERAFMHILLAGGNPFLICRGGLFNVFDKVNIVLANHEVVKKGTQIALYPECADDPANVAYLSRRLYEYLNQVYPVGHMPDTMGEVGEKIQDLDIPPMIYDIAEFSDSKMPLTIEPWRSRVIEALRKSPGTVSKLKTDPTVSKLLGYLLDENIDEELPELIEDDQTPRESVYPRVVKSG